MKSMRQLINLMEGVVAVPGVGNQGGQEADMQTAGTVGRGNADAAFDASQHASESAGDHRQHYMDANKSSSFKPSQEQRPKQTPWSEDPIAAATDRVYDMFSDKKDGEFDENISIDDLFNGEDNNEPCPTCDGTGEGEFGGGIDSHCIACNGSGLASRGHEEHNMGEDLMGEDLNNGYDDIECADGEDFFPDGADSPVVRSVGPSGARQGDNPEQKKMQVAEVHKELVYGYRNYLNESKKKVN